MMKRAVLQLLLAEHPAQLTIDEVVLELATPVDWAKRDEVEVALTELVQSGLVHRHGRFVFPTHAAVRFEALEE
jgi:hypothetical protein